MKSKSAARVLVFIYVLVVTVPGEIRGGPTSVHYAVSERRSVRAFPHRPIPVEILYRVLDAAPARTSLPSTSRSSSSSAAELTFLGGAAIDTTNAVKAIPKSAPRTRSR